MFRTVGRLLAIAALFSLAVVGTAGSVEISSPAAAAPSSEQEILVAQADFDVERREWERIKESKDPADFVRFVERYPNSVFRPAAETVILRLPPPIAGQSPAAGAAAPADAQTTYPPGLAVAVQTSLIRLGCLSGSADGDWGQGSRDALTQYARRRGKDLSTLEPTQDLLIQLSLEREPVCSTKCDVTEVSLAGQCVRKTCDQGQTLNSRGNCVAVAAPPVRCGAGEVKRGNRCVIVRQPAPKRVVTCGPGESLRDGVCRKPEPQPAKPVRGYGRCPEFMERGSTGKCVSSTLCRGNSSNRKCP